MAYNQSNTRGKQQYQHCANDTTMQYQPLEEETYVKRAENVIKKLQGNKLTTTQLRNILSMLNEIYNDVMLNPNDTLSEEIKNRLQYLKIKLIYAAGRNKDVKTFMIESQIDQHLDYIDNSREKFILYSHYMEALVAYHRFYDDKD